MKVQKHIWNDTNEISYEYLLFAINKISYYVSFFSTDDAVYITDEFLYFYDPKDEYFPTQKQKRRIIKRIYALNWWNG